MNRNMARAFFILLIIVLTVLMTSCSSGQVEEQTIIFDQYYIIDPKTLLASIDQSNTNAITPVSKQPEFLPKNQQQPISWIQRDYLYLATSLYRSTLKKSLQGWQLHNMDFRSTCNDIDDGFQNGRFEFFSVAKEGNAESRISRFIDIDTRGNFVHINETKYDPKLEDWDMIDLEKMKVTAEQAFQIAEKNGGKDKRQSAQNGCEVSVGLAPDYASYRGWEVIYTNIDGTLLFRIQIDPYTGEIHFPE